MNYNKKDILTAVSFALFIISFAVIFTTFFTPLYSYSIDVLQIDTYTGLSKEVLLNNYEKLIQYQSIFYNGELMLPDFAMSTNGRIHFEEVKVIFSVVQVLCMFFFVSTIYCIYDQYKKKRFLYMKLTSTLAIMIPLVIGFICMIDFDSAFIVFHKIFFRNDYWIFDVRYDPVITILPQDFFMYCFISIIIIILLFSSTLGIIYKIKEKKILNEK